MNRPSFKNKEKISICIICEGYEEYDYLNSLLNLDVWSNLYEFTLINAQSNGNISARFQDKYQNGSYDIVLAFCDTDRKPFEDFERIRKNIDRIFGIENSSDKVVMFGNPCTLQIVLLHFQLVKLRTQNKKKNNDIVEQCTGIKNYKASEEQRNQLSLLMNKDNYNLMKKNIAEFSTDYKDVPSTNFAEFLDAFERESDEWAKEIMNMLF